jgi:hypothetical protein
MGAAAASMPLSSSARETEKLYPKGFYPLPHPKHTDGGFVFPHFAIDAIRQQDGRDLTRFRHRF